MKPSRRQNASVSRRTDLPRSIAGCAALVLVLGGCLAGPSTVLGGGPIGRAPNTASDKLLADPDSTRGQGFVLLSNRRDVMEETRVELNVSARAFERYLGEGPLSTELRLTSSDSSTAVGIRVGGRALALFTVAYGSAGRDAIPRRVAGRIVATLSREWLSDFLRGRTPNDRGASPASWMEEARISPWLRVGLLEGVAESPIHDLWLIRLGRMRDSLPPLERLLAADSCDAACLAPLVGVGALLLPSDGGERDGPSRGIGREPGRGNPSLVLLDGRARFVASSYALTLFFLKREGPAFVRAMVDASLGGRDPASVFGMARSFTTSLDDIDRQWRVWLATYAEGPKRRGI